MLSLRVPKFVCWHRTLKSKLNITAVAKCEKSSTTDKKPRRKAPTKKATRDILATAEESSFQSHATWSTAPITLAATPVSLPTNANSVACPALQPTTIRPLPLLRHYCVGGEKYALIGI